jgi:hypothetical protein
MKSAPEPALAFPDGRQSSSGRGPCRRQRRRGGRRTEKR